MANISSEKFAIELLHVCSAQLIAQAGYAKSHGRCVDVLSSVMRFYIELLSNKCSSNALLCQRNQVNFTDLLLCFQEMALDLDELREYVRYQFLKKKFQQNEKPMEKETLGDKKLNSNQSNGDLKSGAIKNEEFKEEIRLFPRIEPASFPLEIDNLLVKKVEEVKEEKETHFQSTIVENCPGTDDIDMNMKQTLQLQNSEEVININDGGLDISTESAETKEVSAPFQPQVKESSMEAEEKQLFFLENPISVHEFTLTLMKNPAQEWPLRPKHQFFNQDPNDDTKSDHPMGLTSHADTKSTLGFDAHIKLKHLKDDRASMHFNENQLLYDIYTASLLESSSFSHPFDPVLNPTKFENYGGHSIQDNELMDKPNYKESYSMLLKKFQEPTFRFPLTLREYMFALIRNNHDICNAEQPLSSTSSSPFVKSAIEPLVTMALPKLPYLHVLKEQGLNEKQSQRQHSLHSQGMKLETHRSKLRIIAAPSSTTSEYTHQREIGDKLISENINDKTRSTNEEGKPSLEKLNDSKSLTAHVTSLSQSLTRPSENEVTSIKNNSEEQKTGNQTKIRLKMNF